MLNNQSSTGVGNDSLIEFMNWIEKIEIRLDALEKKFGNLAWEKGSHQVVQMNNDGIDEGKFRDLEQKLDNHIHDYE